MELNDPILKPEEAKDTTMNQEPISVAETANAEWAEVVEMTEPSVVAAPVSEETMEAPMAAQSDESDVAATEAEEHPRHRILTKDEILDEVRRLSVLEANEISAEEISRLKQQFYSLRNEELRAEREEFLSVEGNTSAACVPTPDPVEDTFKDLLGVIRDKKAAQRAAVEAEQQANYERKQAIIEIGRAHV